MLIPDSAELNILQRNRTANCKLPDKRAGGGIAYIELAMQYVGRDEAVLHLLD